MLISIIVTTYNRSDALLAVLDALALQTDTGFEVIVADDGSRDEHVRALHENAGRWPFALTHAWQADVGFTLAASRNFGVRQAHGKYLVFLDGDCVPLPDFVRRHRELARPRCIVNGSRVLLGPELTANALREGIVLPSRGAAWWLAQRLRGACNKWLALYLRWPARLRRARSKFRWKGIRGCNIGVWKSDLDAVDGFDEGFDGWGHEDADFMLRMQHAGCARIDGFWATEVLHLWHRESPRGQQSRNRERVEQRMLGDVVRAEHGLHNPRLPGLERRVSVLRAAPADGTHGHRT